MARIKLYGPDGDEIELYQGIGFLRSRTVWLEGDEDGVDCIATETVSYDDESDD